MNKKNRTNILLTILIFILIIIGLYTIVILFSKFGYKSDGNKEYKVLPSIKDDGKNMNLCLPGCVRGACNKSNKSNSCKYDFQCDYCQDKDTNMFYVNFETEKDKEIVPLYEEEKLNNNQSELLNKSINKNNVYITELNKKIKIMNN